MNGADVYKTARVAVYICATVIMAPLQLYVDFYSSLFKSLWTLVFAQLYTPQPLPKRDLSGRIAIVTGANSGIGLSIATHLTSQGATVYLACRSQERGAKAVDEIVSKIGDESRDRLHCWKLDTSDLSSVRAFCTRWEQEGSHEIDMLIHNAGIATVVAGSPGKTPDGNDLLLTTNFYGSFLMTRLLLSHLTSTARVVLTSSTGSYGALDFLQPPKTKASAAPGFLARLGTSISTSLKLTSPSAPAYSHSKALQVLFAYLLQAQFDLDRNNRRSAHSFGPGFTSTPIFSKFDYSWRFVLVDPFFMLLKVTERYVAVDADQGARTGSWLASEGSKEGGGGFWEWGVRRTSLVDFLRGTLGKEEWEKRVRGEWKGWEERTGAEWKLEVIRG